MAQRQRDSRTHAAVAGALAARADPSDSHPSSPVSAGTGADATVAALHAETAALRARAARAETALAELRKRDAAARGRAERVISLEREVTTLREDAAAAAVFKADAARLEAAAREWAEAFVSAASAAEAALSLPLPGSAAGTPAGTPARSRLSSVAEGTPARRGPPAVSAADAAPEDLTLLVQRMAAVVRRERAATGSARKQFAAATEALAGAEARAAAAEEARAAAAARAAGLAAKLAAAEGRAAALGEACETRGELIESFLNEEKQAATTPRKPKPSSSAAVPADDDADAEPLAGALSAHEAALAQLRRELAAARANAEAERTRAAAAEERAGAAEVAAAAAKEAAERARDEVASAVAVGPSTALKESAAAAACKEEGRPVSLRKHVEQFRRDADAAELAAMRTVAEEAVAAVAAAAAAASPAAGPSSVPKTAAEDNSFGLMSADALVAANSEFAALAAPVARGVLGLTGGDAAAPPSRAGAAELAAAVRALVEAGQNANARLAQAEADAAAAVAAAAAAGGGEALAAARAEAAAAQEEAARARGEVERMVKYLKERWAAAQSRIVEALGFTVEMVEAKKRAVFKYKDDVSRKIIIDTSGPAPVIASSPFFRSLPDSLRALAPPAAPLPEFFARLVLHLSAK